MKNPVPGNFKGSTLLREANPQVGGTAVAIPPAAAYLVRYRRNPRLAKPDGPSCGDVSLSDGQTEIRYDSEEGARARAVELVETGEAIPADVSLFRNEWLRPSVSLQSFGGECPEPARRS